LQKSKTKKNNKRLKKVILAAALFLFLCFAAAFLIFTGPFLLPLPEETVWVNEPNVAADYDVIVVGAEPEGIAAAVAAARNGMSTLLIEKSSALGGLMTLGKLNFIDMCNGRDGTLLTRGIFSEFYKAVGGSGFDVIKAKNYFLQLVTAEPLLTLRTEAQFPEPVMDGNTITGVKVREKDNSVVYTAKRIIDATADGDLAAKTGAPYTYGREDIGETDSQMGVTLIFELSGVNWFRVYSHLNFKRVKTRLTGISDGMGANGAGIKTAWGYGYEGFSYEPNDPLMRLRGFNIARTRRSRVLVNALIIFGVDPLDERSYAAGIDRAVAELENLLPYLRENVIGFKNAELASVASRLYVRESRHFIGEYQLTIDDVLENRDQWDKIAIGSYPADVQPTADQTYGTVIGAPDRYAIPFRCLVPLGVENLLIVGRCASYTSLAASSARVLPLGMVCGQAAGTAAALSIADNTGFRQMAYDVQDITKLQETLRAQGAYLEDFYIREEIMDHWAYSGLTTLRRIGLLDGGYQNDYGMDAGINRWRYQYIINGILDKTLSEHEYIYIEYVPDCFKIVYSITEALLMFGSDYTFEDKSVLTNDFSEMLEFLKSAGVLTDELERYFSDPDSTPQTAEVVMLLANLYNTLKTDNCLRTTPLH